MDVFSLANFFSKNPKKTPISLFFLKDKKQEQQFFKK